MTKEQFLDKWHFTGHNLISNDLDAVIEHEVEVRINPQPTNSGNRKILYRERLQNATHIKFAYEFTNRATFHEWVTIGAGVEAIIELEDGTITTLPYFAIKFINI